MTLSILLTAFEPFGGRAKNASAEALAGVMQQAKALTGLSLTARLLPVEAGLAADQLRAALDEVRPDVLLSLGDPPAQRFVWSRSATTSAASRSRTTPGTC
jgi:pyrrolidone-carboxylate peptidase